MAGSLNRVMLIGNITQPVEVRSMQNGKRVATFNLATNETWKDKNGERQQKAEYHKIVIFNEALVGIAEKYLDKGSKVYIEGQVETRSWEQDGQKKYTTEIVLRPYKGELTMLDSKSDSKPSAPVQPDNNMPDDFEDDIVPF